MTQPTRHVFVRADLLTELLQDRAELDAIHAWAELTIADCRRDGWRERLKRWMERQRQ
jgi:hypothetical protein